MKGTIEKARHVIVNRLEIPELSRNDHNTTFRCEASNTNLVPSVEMSTTVEMLREYFTTICQMQSHMEQIRYMSLSWHGEWSLFSIYGETIAFFCPFVQTERNMS